MSKLFFDHLLELKEIDKKIKQIAKSADEREELWGLVDEIIHHKVMGCILDSLSPDHHDEFLHLYHTSPHDTDRIFGYLKVKIGSSAEELIKKEIESLSNELVNDLEMEQSS